MFHFTLLLFVAIIFTAFAGNNSIWKKTERCPLTEKKWNIRADEFSCGVKTQLEYHCMVDDKGNSIEACMLVKELKNDCPWIYITREGKPFPGNQGTHCEGNKYCPDKDESFFSNQLFRYPACLVDESKRANFTLVDFKNGRSDEALDDNKKRAQGWNVSIEWSLAGFSFGCVPLLIAVFFLLIKTIKRKETDRDTEEVAELLSNELRISLIQPLDAKLGGESTISCIVKGHTDQTSLIWEKDGVPLDIKDSRKYHGGNYAEPSLTITNISRNDAGIYQCVAAKPKDSRNSEAITLHVVDTIHTFEEVEKQEISEYALEAEKKLMQEGMLILVGDTGTGKTNAIGQVIPQLNKEKKPDDDSRWQAAGTEYDFYNDLEVQIFSRRRIMLIDDCCGKYNTNPVKFSRMKTSLHELRRLTKRESEWRKVVATLRSEEFNYITSHTQNDVEARSLEQCAVELCQIANVNTEREKLTTLQTKCSCKKCKTISWDYVMQIAEEQQHRACMLLLGCPLICRLVAIPYIAQNIESFIERPFITIVQGFEDLRDTDIAAFCGLIYMMLKGGTLDESSMDHDCLRQILMLHSALPEHYQDLSFSIKLITQQLKTVPEYVKIENDKFSCFHEIMTLALFCSFYKMYPNDTIRFCDLQIISDLFRPEGYEDFRGDGVILLAREFMAKTEEDSTCEQSLNTNTSHRDEATVVNQIKKSGYCFLLNEENLNCLKRRIKKEDKSHLFENHPLFLKEFVTG